MRKQSNSYPGVTKNWPQSAHPHERLLPYSALPASKEVSRPNKAAAFAMLPAVTAIPFKCQGYNVGLKPPKAVRCPSAHSGIPLGSSKETKVNRVGLPEARPWPARHRVGESCVGCKEARQTCTRGPTTSTSSQLAGSRAWALLPVSGRKGHLLNPFYGQHVPSRSSPLLLCQMTRMAAHLLGARHRAQGLVCLIVSSSQLP